MKRVITYMVFIGLISFLSQNLCAQQILSAAGNTMENSQGSLSWTLGELAIATLQNDDVILTQGFHQTRLTATGIGLIPGQEWDIRVFPNPTDDIIQIMIDDKSGQARWQYQLFDIKGKLLINDLMSSDLENVSTAILPGATYFLKVFSEGKEPRIFKIVKQ